MSMVMDKYIFFWIKKLNRNRIDSVIILPNTKLIPIVHK